MTTVNSIAALAPAAQGEVTIDTGHKVIAAVVTVALVVVVCGFLVPLSARVRAGRVKINAAEADQQQQQRQRQQQLQLRGSQPATGVLFGADNRISTSRTIAFAWTVIIVYVLVALLLVWPPDWGKALTNLYPTYFLLLGGPYAALILAKGITSARTTSGSLVKTDGDGTANFGDLVSDDTGRTDLFDSQYVLFNILAMWFVVAAFFRATLDGFPEVPNGLVLLTAGPAAVYLSNKLFGSTESTITTVTPLRVVEGDTFSVLGTNLLAGRVAGGADGQVLVNGIRASTRAQDWSDTSVKATAPNVGEQDGAPVDVHVTTAAGATLKTSALTVDCRPHIQGFNVSSAAPGQDVTLTVDWPARTTANTQSCIKLDRTIVNGPIIAGPGRATCTFTVPDTLPPELRGRDIPVTVQGSGPESPPQTLTLQP